MRNNILFMFRLISSVLTGADLPKSDEGVCWETIYDISKHHSIVNIIGYALLSGSYNISEELKQKFIKNLYERVYVSENQNNELKILIGEFEKEGIDYLPLKGATLQKLYPSGDMRPMADVDILVKTEQYPKIADIMDKNGYTFSNESDHEYNYLKKPFVHIELHKHLMPTYNEDLYAYFGDGWKLAKKMPDTNFGYGYSNEDNLIYILSHFAKHYRDGGLGIKHVADIWLFIKKHTDMDEEYIKVNLEKLNLYEFYCHLVRMINAWFDGAEYDRVTAEMTEYIIEGGIFGSGEKYTLATIIRNSKNAENAAKFRYVKFIFPNLKKMKKIFPILEKCPFLLPAMWVWRVIRLVLFRRNKIDGFKSQVESIEQGKINEFSAHMNAVGLDIHNGRRN